MIKGIRNLDLAAHVEDEDKLDDIERRVDIKGREDFYDLRYEWAWFLRGTNNVITWFFIVVVSLTGFGFMKFSDSVLWGLTGLAAVDSGVNRYVTKYLFSELPPLSRPLNRC